ncbi:dihydrofolate reductase family protein [Paragemmobacter ruber]|uniref:Dihydrofolate reductase n=1 Tax=Paragemmobacter ruber TaxID=1985673 RepID=A0ABW9Y991_9RHOB|nr:dihydrofolate reductase family protein [Rhodobacter ruber]NBE09100.1 dihydrofolate reductase [Rhodobacter ruber]
MLPTTGPTTGHVFIATSLDGFIARPDGSLDWLLSRDDPTEDHGYDAFIAGMDCIVMGRGSFETILQFAHWPYTLPVLVLSRSLRSIPDHLQGKVTLANLSPNRAMDHLAAQGHRRAYIDGGQIIQSFLRDGLIDTLTISTVPVLLGQGRPLFGTLPADIALTHEATTAFPSGLVQSTWRIA